MTLRDLDARLVPRLAAALRAILDGAHERVERTGSTLRRQGSALLSPPSGGALRRLDDRYASSGPLKLLRDVPQLGVLVVATLFLAGTGAALALSGPEAVRERQEAEREAELPLTLGPAAGDQIDEHFAAARERAVELARREPGAVHLALVSLNKGLTPEEVDALLEESGLQVRRAYLRADVPGDPEVIAVELPDPDDPQPVLRSVFAQTATRKATEQQELLSQAATIVPDTPEQEAFRDLYEADARLAGLEAAAFRTGCACVFALVVEAEVGELAELPALPVVRGVEVAPRGVALPALDIRPLAPSEQGVVAPPSTRAPGDGS
jgi:hypothetical protein